MARYENFVIQNKVNEFLTTKLALSRFVTMDSSLAETDGMIKKVHKYTKSGVAENVTEGNGNANALAVTYAASPYTVKTTQAKFVYSDEAQMADSFYVDKGVEAIAESLVNAFNAAAVAEFKKTTNVLQYTTLDFDAVADAIALLGVEDSEENGFYMLINPAMKAEFRKNLKEELRYVEAYARQGYIGSVCGIPVYVSKLVDTPIIASKEAVTAFIKKDTVVEQDRNIDTRTNTVVGRMVNVIALTDETKCVKFVKK